MNWRRNSWYVGGSVLVVALFMALWKVAAPIRMRRQFEAQAVSQLANTTMGKNNKFDSIRVISFRYNAQADAYDVQYQLNYGDSNSPASTWSSCPIVRQGGSFQSQCYAFFSNSPVSFNISIHE